MIIIKKIGFSFSSSYSSGSGSEGQPPPSPAADALCIVAVGNTTSPPIKTTARARKNIATAALLFTSVFCMKLEEEVATLYPFMKRYERNQ
jgi:hypothetical protein